MHAQIIVTCTQTLALQNRGMVANKQYIYFPIPL